MKIKFLITLLALLFTVNTVSAQVLKSNAITKRIPAGTKFSIKLLDPISTQNSNEGDYLDRKSVV